jgi:tetratricopeptide (TPR) repeat protein
MRVGVGVTRAIRGARILLSRDGVALREWITDLGVAEPFRAEVELGDAAQAAQHSIRIEANGAEILRYDPPCSDAASEPQVATEPPLPEEIASSDEIYLTGLHLEQYRHATRRPEVYWQEALRRDAGDARSNNALGLWRLRRGEFAEAERHFRTAIARLTQRNSNPRDGEPHYNLGLALRFIGNGQEAHEQGAYDAFAKAAWSAAWCGPAYAALAEIDARRGAWDLALDHIQRSLAANPENLNARNLHAMILRKPGSDSEATAILRETLARDPLDVWAHFLSGDKLPASHQQLLDLAFDLGRGGFYEEAVSLLRSADLSRRDGSAPIILYAMADFCVQMGDARTSAEIYQRAAQAPPDYCFPSRLEELVILERAIAVNPGDARAQYYLGNFLYDRRRHEEAIAAWERSVQLDPLIPTAWRNLGIAYFNVAHDAARAREAFDRAFAAGPDDARVFYERDQLSKRVGEAAQIRLAELERYPNLCELRDDLTVELATLLNQTRQPARALELLLSRKFQPWEGGEGLVLAQFTHAHLLLGQRALAEGDAASACKSFEAILKPPPSLGEARHLLANQSDVWFWLGASHARNGDCQQAEVCWTRATRQRGDFQQMSVRAVSEMTFWSALACQCLGRKEEAASLLGNILEYAEQLERQTPKVDYFATSLPAMLLFEDDLEKRNRIEALFLRGQAFFGQGKSVEAVRSFKEVLELDRNHAGAADLLEQIGMLREIAGLE